MTGATACERRQAHSTSLDEPFVVLANAESARNWRGQYPLPEAKLDRFFFKLHVPISGANELHESLDRTTGGGMEKRRAVLDRDCDQWRCSNW